MDFAHDFLRYPGMNSVVKVSSSIIAWISPEQDAIVMAYNVSPDMKGLSWAAAFNGIYLLKDDIRVIREVVQGNSLFKDVMRTAKQTHKRITVMEYDHPLGNYTFEIEGMPCLGTFVVIKQGSGRICRMKSREFLDFLKRIGIQLNADVEMA